MLTFQELYDTYAADVYRFALWLAGDAFQAEDITADTFVRAWTSNSPIRTETLKAYLFTIARNLYLEQCRKANRQSALNDAQPDPLSGPDQIAAARLELQRIRRILLALPETDRAAFILRVQHDLPYAEIARILEISLSSSKVKVHRVRKKLLVIRLDEEVK
jgi:RNA polymerase sigma-70 factor (ECF subfamily)